MSGSCGKGGLADGAKPSAESFDWMLTFVRMTTGVSIAAISEAWFQKN